MKSAQEISQQVQELGRWIPPLREQVAHVVVGQKYLVDRLLLGLLANGHVLLEGVPGLAKTLTVKTIASAIQTGFQRLQFTPDLLPADLIGTLIYNPRDGEFTTKFGPIFRTSSWPTKSIALPRKYRAPYWKRCKSARSQLAKKRIPFPIRF